MRDSASSSSRPRRAHGEPHDNDISRLPPMVHRPAGRPELPVSLSPSTSRTRTAHINMHLASACRRCGAVQRQPEPHAPPHGPHGPVSRRAPPPTARTWRLRPATCSPTTARLRSGALGCLPQPADGATRPTPWTRASAAWRPRRVPRARYRPARSDSPKRTERMATGHASKPRRFPPAPFAPVSIPCRSRLVLPFFFGEGGDSPLLRTKFSVSTKGRFESSALDPVWIKKEPNDPRTEIVNQTH